MRVAKMNAIINIKTGVGFFRELQKLETFWKEVDKGTIILKVGKIKGVIKYFYYDSSIQVLIIYFLIQLLIHILK